MLSDRCPACLSVLPVTLVYCGQTVGWIKMKLGMLVELGPHCVRWGPMQLPPRKGAPIFVPCLLWPNGGPSQLLLGTCNLKMHPIYVSLTCGKVYSTCHSPWFDLQTNMKEREEYTNAIFVKMLPSAPIGV